MAKAKSDKITIVIPAYNREKELKRCLDSIFEQTLLPTEVIVVDDGSTDETVAVAKSHPIGAKVLEGRHAGACAARNQGLAEVKTEWTMFFDSDDIMLPSHVEKATKGIGPDVDILGWDILKEITDGKFRLYRFSHKDIAWHNIMHSYLATQRYAGRTELFRKVGGWNETVPIWNDIELGNRLLWEKPKVKKIEGCGAKIFLSANSITGPTFASRFDQYPIALREIRKHLPAEHHDWVDLKKAILAADISRDDKALGRRLYDEIENKTLGIRLAYWYRRLGGRGAARLLRSFFSKDKSDSLI